MITTNFFNSQMDSMGLSLSRFGDIAAETKVEVTQAIITLMGGLEEFTSATSAYVNAFFTDAEKTAMLGESLGNVFSDLGLELPGDDVAHAHGRPLVDCALADLILCLAGRILQAAHG